MEPRDETPEDPAAGTPEQQPDPTLSYDPVDEAQRLRAREAAAGIPGLEGFGLVVTEGPHAGTHWTLSPGRNEAGRHVEAELFLDDITVSRHHAAFLCEGSRLRLEDLGSTNGTYVNGKREERAQLSPGDEVIIGRFHLVVARGA
jgi:pSer/pThr/pTyr-binding forkhead associated (FHA) protein